jgi:hypothetical protein
MHTVLNDICVALESLAETVLDNGSGNGYLITEMGWNYPALTRGELAGIPQIIAGRIKAINRVDLEEHFIAILEPIPEQINLLTNSATITYMFNGNGHQAIPAFLATLQYVTMAIEPLFQWEETKETKLLPPKLMSRLRSIQTSIDELEIKKSNLQEDINLIKEARETADSLPTDLASLKEARNMLNKYNSEAAELKGKMDVFYEKATNHSDYIGAKKLETDKLVEQCEEAYRITTTKGLAGAFDERAKKLSNSMWYCVIGLVVALGLGSYIGSLRLNVLSDALKTTDPSWGIIWMHITLSILSIGAPLWLAWLATKQIGQRFRLSEDYSFKASVAKAYEGYRKEAARIDSAFEARLFSSALSRLEEAPLRLVEEDSHGSPWHELFKSKSMQKSLEIMPDIKDAFLKRSSQPSVATEHESE